MAGGHRPRIDSQLKRSDEQIPPHDLLHFYVRDNVNRKWLRRLYGDEVIDLLDKVFRPVTLWSRQQRINRSGEQVRYEDVYRHHLTVDYFQANFLRALEALPGFDPKFGVPVQEYIGVHLRTRPPGQGHFDHVLSVSQHGVRKYMSVRREHPDDKNAQREAWSAGGTDTRGFDNLLNANWPVHIDTLPFDGFADMEIGFRHVDVESDDPSTEDFVEGLIDAERLALWIDSLDDEERMMVQADNDDPRLTHDEIALKCRGNPDRSTISKRLKALYKRGRHFMDPPDDADNDDD